MGFSYQLLARAEKEYFESFLWYEEQQSGLGERFDLCLRKKLNYISANPGLYSKRKGRFYETALGKPFPLVIIFLIDKKREEIIVTSIFHTSRHPGKRYKK